MNEHHLKLECKINEHAIYYWALQYAHGVEILEPAELRNKMKEGLKKILLKYDS